MKKSISFLILFLCFLLFELPTNAAGACSNATKKELSIKAKYVKIESEVVDNSEEKELTIDGNTTTYRVPNYYFNISIYNLSENLYAEISTTNNNKARRIYYDDTTDSNYSFIDSNIGEIYNYTFAIKSDDCPGTTLKTFKFTKPRYNAYSEFTYCQNSSNYYCQKFIGTEINIKNTADFLSKIFVNNEKNNPLEEEETQENDIDTLLKNNWLIYVIIFISIAGLSVVTIIVVRKLNKNKGWKL